MCDKYLAQVAVNYLAVPRYARNAIVLESEREKMMEINCGQIWSRTDTGDIH